MTRTEPQEVGKDWEVVPKATPSTPELFCIQMGSDAIPFYHHTHCGGQGHRPCGSLVCLDLDLDHVHRCRPKAAIVTTDQGQRNSAVTN